LRKLNLPSLTYRRLRGDLIECFKYLRGVYKLKETILPLHRETEGGTEVRSDRMETRGHELKLKKRRSEKEVRRTFFSHRVVNWWNSLPVETILVPSLNAFKNRLDRHLAHLRYSIDFPLKTAKTNLNPRQGKHELQLEETEEAL